MLRISAEHTNAAVAAQLANTVAQVFVSKNNDFQAARFASSRDSLAQLVGSLQQDVDEHLRQIDSLRAQASSPERDAELARLQGELTQLESTHGASVRSYEDLRVVEARGMNTLTVIEPAVPPETPVRPNRTLVTLLAALTGLVLAAGAAGLADYLDDVLRDRQRVSSLLGLSTLGLIPVGEAGTSLRDPSNRRLTENYRLLRSNLVVSVARGDQLRTVLVASPAVGEGKSTTAANLAVALAESGRRVTLVDADMHRPTQMQLFSVSNRLGLSTLLLDESQSPSAVERPTWLPNLTIIPAGPLPAEPSALLSAHRADEVLAQLRELCDVVVIDTPPLLAQPDAALLGSRADGVLLVVDATKSRGRQAARALEMLQESGALMLGAVLNRIPKRSIEYPAYDSYYARPPEDSSGPPADGGSSETHRAPAPEPSPQSAQAHAASLVAEEEANLSPATATFPARFPVGRVLISSADYQSAVASIIEAARARCHALVAATSVHGLTLGALDPVFGRQLNDFDMLTTDGQPVRWALNLLHGVRLNQRVYGPTLMLRVCEVAAANQLGVFLYGGRPEVLQRLVRRLPNLVPGLRIAGFQSPPFRDLTLEEDDQDVRRIVESGAQIVFVGLGCPRQERWAHAHRDRFSLPIICVGAAFDFHAGTLRQAPVWMQDRGLEWLFRLIMEPRRLCRRYAMHIPLFILLLAREYALRRVLNRRIVQPA